MIASSKSDQEDFQIHHSLILQIFYNVPALLLNVIPQLEEELKVENVMIRSCATKTLGKMFARKGVQYVDAYQSVFKSWCDRRNDKTAQIRLEWVHIAGEILKNQPEMINTLETFLKSKLHDPEDKVRVGALSAIGIVCSDHPDLLHETTLQEVASRCRDKKSAPRIEAMRVLGGLFDKVYNLALQTEEISLDQFMWIPGNILEVLYLDDTEMSIVVEKTVLSDLIPPLPDHNARTVRMLRILCGLNEKQRNAFLSILTRQAAAIQTFTIFIDHCVIMGGNGDEDRKIESEKIVKKVANFLVAKMPDRVKAYTHLMKIVELNNGRVFKLFRNIMNPAMDFKSILKYTKELDSILSKHSGLLETIGVFLRRISLVLMNKDTMDVLLRRVRNGKDQLDKAAEVLIKDISRIFPALYSSQIGTFKSIIITNESSESGMIPI
jgi:sister chromatid cohesion protein PDS5